MARYPIHVEVFCETCNPHHGHPWIGIPARYTNPQTYSSMSLSFELPVKLDEEVLGAMDQYGWVMYRGNPQCKMCKDNRLRKNKRRREKREKANAVAG